MKKGQSVSYHVASLGVLGALAIGLNYLEGFLPPLPVLPPGAKLGLSNIAVMAAAKRGGVKDALAVALLKALFVLLTRGVTAFWMSLAGGLLSAFITALLLKKDKQPFGYIGIGVLGAVCHNLGQLAVAAVLTGPVVLLGYGPYLLLFALLTGALTGLVLKVVMPALERLEEEL